MNLINLVMNVEMVNSSQLQEQLALKLIQSAAQKSKAEQATSAESTPVTPEAVMKSQRVDIRV